MAEELKACPFCGGAVRFHSDEDCHGCHYIECSGCKAMFDFSPTTDPENQCDRLHDLQCGITHAWNTRAQLPSQGGEAVEVVAWRIKGDTSSPALMSNGAALFNERNYPGSLADREPLMTVAQHQRILVAATRPADQVADDLTMVKVPRELLEEIVELHRRRGVVLIIHVEQLAELLNGGRS